MHPLFRLGQQYPEHRKFRSVLLLRRVRGRRLHRLFLMDPLYRPDPMCRWVR